MVWWW